MKNLKDFQVKDKRVLVRCDFNVPLKEGVIEDDFRIKKALPTIEYLVKNGAKVILMTHLGKPEGKVVNSLKVKPIFDYLSKIFSIQESSYDKKLIEKTKSLKPGTCLLLENLRFDEREEKNDREFSQELARLGDIYINEAFGCSHRLHSSVVGITEFLPSGAGFLLEKEIESLEKIMKEPLRPLVSVIGGVKINTKIKLIKNLSKKSDELILGGELANTILRVNGLCIGPWPEEKIVKQIKEIDFTSNRVHLPVDVIASADKEGKTYVRESPLAKVRNDEWLLDIGPESIELFSQVIKKAKTIILAGPLGYFENPLFEKGTERIIEIITKNHSAYKLVGGGDTLFAISKFGAEKGFDHISTGGGAMLNFLSGEELPGIVALNEKSKKSS